MTMANEQTTSETHLNVGNVETKMVPERNDEETKMLEAMATFEATMNSIRTQLTGLGHLALVTDEGFREAKRNLIKAIGQQRSDKFLSDLFAKGN